MNNITYFVLLKILIAYFLRILTEIKYSSSKDQLNIRCKTYGMFLNRQYLSAINGY